MNKTMSVFFAVVLFILFPQLSYAADPAASGLPTEEVDLEKIKEKYWAKGNEDEIGVVQNRLYSKRKRIEVGLGLGAMNGDPFLSMTCLGGALGYHITDFISAHVLGFGTFVSNSSALGTLQSQTGTTANTNYPKNYFGGEVRGNLLYGKVSVISKTIWYFDLYFALGSGRMDTESGANIVFSGGLGQQVHLSKLLALNVDFRLLSYKETVLGKGTTNFGQDLGRVNNLTNLFMLSLSVFTDSLSGEKI